MAIISAQNKEALRALAVKTSEEVNRDVLIETQSLAEAKAGSEQMKISEIGIVNRYESLLADVRLSYQGQTAQEQERFDSEREAEEKAERESALSEAKEAKRIAESERRKHRVLYDWPKYRWIVVFEIVGFLAETSYNVFSLSVGGGSLLLSIAPAFVVAISLCSFAVYLGTSLRDKSPEEQRNLIKRFAGWMLLVFVAISTLRSFAVISEGSMVFSAETLIGATTFVVIQALIFGGSVVLAMQLPSKEDRICKLEYDKWGKDIQDAENVIAECKKAKETAARTVHVRQKERIDRAGELAQLESLVANLCRQSLSMFYRELSLRMPQMKFDCSILTAPLFQKK